MKFLQELLTRNNASLRTEKTTGSGKYTHFLDFNWIRIFFSQCIRVSSLLESFQLIFQSTATAFVYWLFNYCSKARHPLLWIAGYTSPDFDASKSNGKSITQKIIVNSINIGIVTFFIFQTPWSLIVIFGFSLEFSCFCIFCTFWMFYVNSSCVKKEYTLSIT